MKAFKVEFETQDRKNLKVVIDNKKEFTLYNHLEFPIDEEAVKALKKEVAKELRKAFKKYDNAGAMITISVLNDEYYTIPLYRFTFENNYYIAGAKFVEHRPFENNEFEVTHTSQREEKGAIQEVNKTIDELVHSWFDVWS